MLIHTGKGVRAPKIPRHVQTSAVCLSHKPQYKTLQTTTTDIRQTTCRDKGSTLQSTVGQKNQSRYDGDMMLYTDGTSCTLPLRSPTSNTPSVVSSSNLQTSAERWTSAFLSTAYSSPTTSAVRTLYPPGLPRQTSTILSLDPLPLRHLPPSVQRFRETHPSQRQPAFTIHHGAHSDLTVPG